MLHTNVALATSHDITALSLISTTWQNKHQGLTAVAHFRYNNDRELHLDYFRDSYDISAGLVRAASDVHATWRGPLPETVDISFEDVAPANTNASNIRWSIVHEANGTAGETIVDVPQADEVAKDDSIRRSPSFTREPVPPGLVAMLDRTIREAAAGNDGGTEPVELTTFGGAPNEVALPLKDYVKRLTTASPELVTSDRGASPCDDPAKTCCVAPGRPGVVSCFVKGQVLSFKPPAGPEMNKVTLHLPRSAFTNVGAGAYAIHLRNSCRVDGTQTDKDYRPSVIPFDARWFPGGVDEYTTCLRTPRPLLAIASPKIRINEDGDPALDGSDLIRAGKVLRLDGPEAMSRCPFDERASTDSSLLAVRTPSPDGFVALFFAERLDSDTTLAATEPAQDGFDIRP